MDLPSRIRHQLSRAVRPAVPLDARQRTLLVGLVAAAIFDQYDAALLSLALPQTQSSLHIPDALLGLVGAVVRASAVGAMFVLLFAERVGRRRLLLWTIGGYSLLTGASAFAPSIIPFVVMQAVSRALITAEGLLAVVVLTGALPPSSRGWGIGLVGSLGALGTIAAYAMFPAVMGTGLGWRALYVIGALPAGFLWAWRRSLAAPPAGSVVGSDREDGALRDVSVSFRFRPRVSASIIKLAIIVGVWASAVSSAWFFVPKHLHDLGWTAGAIGGVAVVGGLFAIPAPLAAGRLSDHVGRRLVTLACFALASGFAYLVFNTEGAAVTAVIWIAFACCFSASNSLAYTYAAELARPAERVAATALVGTAWIAGGTIGLAGESVLYTAVGSHERALSLLVGMSTMAVVAFAAAQLPESRHVPLPEHD